MDMGTNSSSPTQQQTTITELPEWARPYAQNILAKGSALTEQKYTPYQGERYAGLSDLQKTAMGSVASPQAYGQTIQGYMSPYMQNVVDIQKREAARQSNIMGAQQQAQATGAGAFGGYRDAIQRAERERNLGQQMNDIQERGLQSAYQAAEGTFGRNLQAQTQLGALQQQDIQRPLDIAYQDFQNQLNYPYKQLGFMSDLLRGTPTGQSASMTMYQAPGSMMGQLGGLGMGAYGLSRLMAKDGGLMDSYAEGGEVDEYAGGGLTDLSNFSNEQLKVAYRNALDRRDVDLANAIEAQIARNDSMRGAMSAEDASIAYGLGGAFDALPQDAQERMLAGGGIVAFAGGGTEGREMSQEEATSTAGDLWRSITSGLQSQIDKAARAGQLREQMKENRVGFFEALTPTQRTERQERGSQLRSQYDELLGRTPAAKSTSAVPAYDSDTAERADRMTGGEEPAPKAAPKVVPKTEKSISNALNKMSEESGVPKEDLMTTFEAMRKRFEEEGAADRREMSDLMKSFMGEGKKYRAQALDRALTEFGFGMAAQAAQPGQARNSGLAGVLQSAAAASPILAKSAAESDKIAREMEANDQRMALNLKQFEIAQRSGNRKDAMNLAVQQQTLQRQNEQLGLQRQQLQETMRSNLAREGLSAKQLEIAANKQGITTATLRTRAKSLASQDVARMYKQDPMLAIQDKKNGITPEMRLQRREQEYTTDLLLGLVGTPKLATDED